MAHLGGAATGQRRSAAQDADLEWFAQVVMELRLVDCFAVLKTRARSNGKELILRTHLRRFQGTTCATPVTECCPRTPTRVDTRLPVKVARL
jgi:hypothetical protein